MHRPWQQIFQPFDAALSQAEAALNAIDDAIRVINNEIRAEELRASRGNFAALYPLEQIEAEERGTY